MDSSATAPRAERRDDVRSFHGHDFHDPYEWLRAKEDPAVIAYLDAENAYTASRTAHLDALKRSIFEERKARTQQTDQSVPTYATTSDGTAYWHYARTIEGRDYAVHCRVRATSRDDVPDLTGDVAGEEILLDGNAEAEGHEFFGLGGIELSPSGRYLAYLADYAGDERFVLTIRDLRDGSTLPDRIEDLGYGLAWAGEEHLFYARVDDAWRQCEIWRHKLGTDAAEDQRVLHEADERFSIYAYESRQRDFLIIGSHSKLSSECWLLPTSDPEGEPRSVHPREENLEYDVEVGGDRLFIVHNATCVDGELASAPLTATGRDHWTPVLPGQEGVRIAGADAYRDWVVLSIRRDGLSGVHVIPRNTAGDCEPGHDLTFDEPLYDVSNLGDAEYDTDRIRLAYTSLTTPDSVYDCHLDGGELVLRKRLAVLDDPVRGAYDPTDYVQRREWATAPDGTKVPISVVHHKDLTLDGSNPCLLYGYGSYEACIAPQFSIARIPLLERGFVYAIAHVRGGGEMGRRWYDDGKILTKKNTFSDFVACAEHMIDAGYTNPDKLAAEGRSAGGLLMGAITNLAPTTFRAVHAGVPFVDALTSMLKPELPLTITEWEEWGDPFHDAEAYEYMRSYTPYENIGTGRYPAILATTSLNDTRVLYVEPAKWIAELRTRVEDAPERPILLHTEMVAGHGGVSGRYGKWEQTAFEYAWICDQLGVTE